MESFIASAALVPVRKEDSHRSEMVSQLVWGEGATMIEEKGEFIKITCAHDGYEGWVQKTQMQAIKSFERSIGYISEWCHEVTVDDVAIRLPFATAVHEKKGGEQMKAGLLPLQETFTVVRLQEICNTYLGTPYLWGGRSVFGIDCSGFAQQAMKHFGIRLPRDAWQQAAIGEAVTYENAAAGDLAFFHNEKGKITHVGIVYPDKKIIHASGVVRIDNLLPEGIFRSGDGINTHQLHSIRRIVGVRRSS